MIILLYKKNVASKNWTSIVGGGKCDRDAENYPIHWDFFVKTVLSNLRRFALVVQLVK
jgi:hypothetical protein